jgi:hypothetical protein
MPANTVAARSRLLIFVAGSGAFVSMLAIRARSWLVTSSVTPILLIIGATWAESNASLPPHVHREDGRLAVRLVVDTDHELRHGGRDDCFR